MKICLFRKRTECYAKIDNKIYSIDKTLLDKISKDSMIEIISVALSRADIGRITSELFGKTNNKRTYIKQLENPKGYLSFGIILGDNLNISEIPLETRIKRRISINEWNQKVKNNIFMEKLERL